MNAVAPMEPAPLPAAVSETAAIIHMIERAATNPDVDIDKMERLLAMQERVLTRNAAAAYDAALAVMQPELPVIDERGGIKDKGGNVQSTYARWEDINDAIKPILAKHGFALSFRVSSGPQGVSVRGILAGHGHREETEITLPADGSGSKNAVQAVGSSTSYGQRYTAKLLLNLTSRGADDDGKRAGSPTITEDQVAELDALLIEAGADKAKFLAYGKVESLSDIKADAFDNAKKAVLAKRKAVSQ
jgi:hypothetical protein